MNTNSPASFQETLNSMLPYISIVVSLCSLIFVYMRVRGTDKANRAVVIVNLIDKLYFDPKVQSVLGFIFADCLKTSIEEQSRTAVVTADGVSEPVTDDVDVLLNRLQVLGRLYVARVIRREDVRGLRFEIILVGRNRAIRDYLKYCNTLLQARTNVIHDHFKDFKLLYLELEYDHAEQQSFSECMFKHPEKI